MKKKARILVVEDERIVGEDIKGSLEKMGYDVPAIVHNGQEAIHSISRMKPDLVLLDIVLQGEMNGVEVAEILHQKYNIPAVFLTAYADQDTLERAKFTEPYGYLLKPFEEKELYSTIEMALYKHRMEQRLRKNEAWLSTMLKSIGDAVIATDVDGKIMFINGVAEQLTECMEKEVIQNSLDKTFRFESEKTGEPVLFHVNKMLKANAFDQIPGDTVLITRSGKSIPVEMSIAPIQDDQQNTMGAVFVFRDISERRKAENELKQRDEFNYALFQYNPIETIVVDREGKVIGYNKVKEFSAKRIPNIGDVMYRDYAGKYKQDMHKELMKCIRTGSVKAYPEQHYGEEYLDITISPFSGGAIITSINITERKMAEQALRESEEMYKALVNTSPDSIMVADLGGTILFVSEQTLDMFRFGSTEEVISRSLFELINESDRAEAKAGFERLLDMGIARNSEYKMLRHDKTHFIGEMSIALIKDDRGNPKMYMAITRDITKRRQAEEERNAIQAQLLQVQKMEAIGTLTGGVAHDFNNLLTAIQGCADMLMMRTDEDSIMYRDMKEIQMASMRAAELTRQLLLFSRKQPMAFISINLNKIIENLLKMLHRLIGEDIGIITSLEADLWPLHGDKGTLEQVIMNLSVNAKQAMPGGGKLTIKTENVTIDEAQAKKIPEARPGRFVRLSVLDTGIGMSEEIIKHIFEPFFSTKGPGKGTGLGLAVVYGIVTQHGGWINIQSAPGKGTVFEIYIEAVDIPPLSQDTEETDLSKYRGNGEKILVVEDEESVQAFLSMALEENGYNVYPAREAEEAVQLFKKEKGLFDLVICDVVLPDKDGVQLISDLIQINPSIQIVLSSGYTDQKSQWDAIQEKGYPFLQKPYPLRTLLKTVKKHIKKENNAPGKARRTVKKSSGSK